MHLERIATKVRGTNGLANVGTISDRIHTNGAERTCSSTRAQTSTCRSSTPLSWPWGKQIPKLLNLKSTMVEKLQKGSNGKDFGTSVVLGRGSNQQRVRWGLQQKGDLDDSDKEEDEEEGEERRTERRRKRRRNISKRSQTSGRGGVCAPRIDVFRS